MTTITLPRAVLEQALEALEMCRLNGSQYLYGNERDLVFSAIKALRAALAQQAEQAWVCPDSPEHRYAKPGHCEDCGKTLVQEQGCDHCNHPLYAATRCRVCGRVTA